MTNADVFAKITDLIVDSLNAGRIPWRKPWNAGGETPTNAYTGKPYKGINVLILNSTPFVRPFFVTYKQAELMGGNVKKGEKSTLIVFWQKSTYTKKNDQNEEEEKTGFILKTWYVFNVEQCENLKFELPTLVENTKNEEQKIEALDAIFANYPNAPKFQTGGNRAYFSPTFDLVNMPEKKYFDNVTSYYATLSHEYVHSTGVAKRLNRKDLVETVFFGDKNYSKEELTAEIGANFLLASVGIDIESTGILENSKGYIQGWVKKLKSEPKWIVNAANNASKAVAYILNEQGETE